MKYQNDRPRIKGYARTLRQREELPLLRDHLLRLDRESRYDRFHGVIDDSFVERYAARCADDGTVIVAYLEGGEVRGAAELHPPEQAVDHVPEIAFSVEQSVRRQGVGSILFTHLISEARVRGYHRLRITTGAQNQAMRALARKFGAHLEFRYGESTGIIDLDRQPRPPLTRLAATAVIDVVRAALQIQRMGWATVFRIYGLGDNYGTR